MPGVKMEYKHNYAKVQATQLRTSKYVGPALLEAQKAGWQLFGKQVKRFSGRRYMSLKQMAQAGHPYSKRGSSVGRIPAPPWIINLQSGALYRGWAWWTRIQGGKIRSALFVKGKARQYIKFLVGGTSKMIRRPILDRSEKLTRPKRNRFYVRAYDRIRKRWNQVS